MRRALAGQEGKAEEDVWIFMACDHTDYCGAGFERLKDGRAESEQDGKRDAAEPAHGAKDAGEVVGRTGDGAAGRFIQPADTSRTACGRIQPAGTSRAARGRIQSASTSRAARGRIWTAAHKRQALRDAGAPGAVGGVSRKEEGENREYHFAEGAGKRVGAF